MTLLDNWRALLVPSGTFQLQDLWQLIIVIALFTISTKTFGAKTNSVVIKHSTPALWLKGNLSFLALWAALIVAWGICILIPIEAPVFSFFSFLKSFCCFCLFRILSKSFEFRTPPDVEQNNLFHQGRRSC